MTHADLTLWIDTITSIYEQELDRHVDSSGLATFLLAIMTRGKDAEWIRRVVRESPEWAERHPEPPEPDAAPPSSSDTPDVVVVDDTWRPTREQCIAWNGDIARTDVADTHSVWGTWAYPGWDEAMRAAYRTWAREQGYTHVVINARLEYAGYPAFSYLDRPTEFRAICAELLLDRLIPVVCLDVGDEWGTERGARVVNALGRVLPALRGVVPIVMPAWELDVSDTGRTLLPDDIREMIALAKDVLGPETLVAHELGAQEHHGVILYDGRDIHDEDYDVNPHGERELNEIRAVRNYYRRTPIDIVLLETACDTGPDQNDPARWINEIGGAVSRLTGQHAVPARWPWDGAISGEHRHNMRGPDYGIHVPCVLFEFAAFRKWSSAKKRQWRLWAQQVVPDLSGFGDG